MYAVQQSIAPASVSILMRQDCAKEIVCAKLTFFYFIHQIISLFDFHQNRKFE